MTKTCAKCEGRHTAVKYDKVLDLLDYKCEGCEFRWSEYPADRLKGKAGAADEPAGSHIDLRMRCVHGVPAEMACDACNALNRGDKP